MSRVGVQRKKKTRSDKKRDVKPTLPIELKDAIFRLSFITKMPVKDVAEQMILHAFSNRRIIDDLSKHFRRDIRIDSTLYRGSLDVPRIPKRDEGVCEQITTRLIQHDYEMVSALSYALDVSATRVCALLLNASMHDFDFINSYVKRYLKSELTASQLKELQSILKYVNEEVEEKISLANLLSFIVDEVSMPITKLKDSVNEFIQNNWRD